MDRTRFEVRFDDGATPRPQWTERGHRRGGVLPLAEPRRGPPAAGAHRLRRRAVAGHAGAEDAGRRPTRRGKTLDLRRGRRRHRRARRGRRRAEAAARWASAFQVLCITHLPQIAAYGRDALPDREAVDGGRTRDQRRALDGRRPGRRARADDGRRDVVGRRRSGERRARCSTRRRKAKAKGESRRRKAKAKAAAQRRKARMARHEVLHRDLRLPDERPRLRADGGAAGAGRLRADRRRRATPTSSSSTPAACASAPRRSSTRGSARFEQLAREHGPRPDRRGRRLRRAAGRRRAPRSARRRRRRHRRHAEHASGCRCSSTQAARRSRRAAPPIDLDPLRRRRRSRWAWRGAAIRCKAYVTIIEGCNEFCAFCVVPYTRGHERMRPTADILADVARGGRQRAPRGPAARADRQPLPGARRSGVRLRRRCSKRFTRSPGIERIRFASPHPRHVTTALIAAMRDLPKVCKHLHLPVQSGSTRVLAAMRRRLHARGATSTSSRAFARRCRTSRSRPI